MRQVVNDAGRVFNVRIVLKGESYGLDDCLTHDKDDPLVEFYDNTYRDKLAFAQCGQFVSRYYLSTLAASCGLMHGLALHGGEPVWTLNGKNVLMAVNYAQNRLENKNPWHGPDENPKPGTYVNLVLTNGYEPLGRALDTSYGALVAYETPFGPAYGALVKKWQEAVL